MGPSRGALLNRVVGEGQMRKVIKDLKAVREGATEILGRMFHTEEATAKALG